MPVEMCDRLLAVEHLGRRGKPVKKMRFVPAEKAFAIARKLQGIRACTVSVI